MKWCSSSVMELRIAFCGASGTGKTTLAKYLGQLRGLPLNPVGSRTVSQAMGFDSPYDVDAAGRRGEFQHRLVTEKRAWEDDHDSFVTDRTTLDNLAYTMFHDVYCIDEALLQAVVAGMSRYTHIVYCPVSAFIKHGGDSARVNSAVYHELYDTTIEALLVRYKARHTKLLTLIGSQLEVRQATVKSFLE